MKPLLIGLVNHFTPASRLLDALWVFETLNHVYLNFHAFLVGEGPELDPLLRCREAWKLTPRVHILSPFSPAACCRDLIPQFDVLLNLSCDAAESDSIPDAMLCGVPVIATARSTSPELVADGVTGFLTPESGSDFRLRRRMFAEKTLRLLEDEALRQKMSIAAKEYAAEHFDISKVASRYAELYRDKCAWTQNKSKS
jgi:glycosyltransferase involved in cell wall biosynthesis